jgi:hypothetical protein
MRGISEVSNLRSGKSVLSINAERCHEKSLNNHAKASCPSEKMA